MILAKERITKKENKLISDSFFASINKTKIRSRTLSQLLNGSTEVVIEGLSLDYCLFYSSLYTLDLGFPTTVHVDMVDLLHADQDILGKVKMSGGNITTWATWKKGLEERNNMTIIVVIVCIMLIYYVLCLIMKCT